MLEKEHYHEKDPGYSKARQLVNNIKNNTALSKPIAIERKTVTLSDDYALVVVFAEFQTLEKDR